MTPIDIQVSRSKVKVKGHANLLHLVQLITQECFAPKASIFVSRWSLMSRWPLLIFRSVGQRSVSKVKSLFFICWGRGALVFYKQLYFLYICSNFKISPFLCSVGIHVLQEIVIFKVKYPCPQWDSNPLPPAFKTGALSNHAIELL